MCIVGFNQSYSKQLKFQRYVKANVSELFELKDDLHSSESTYAWISQSRLVSTQDISQYTVHLFNRYDVWLVDYRLSCKFPLKQVERNYTLDDIATYDYPAAIDKILEVTEKVCITIF